MAAFHTKRIIGAVLRGPFVIPAVHRGMPQWTLPRLAKYVRKGGMNQLTGKQTDITRVDSPAQPGGR